MNHPTPWPREWSPVPGVDLPVNGVLSLCWNVILSHCGIVTDRSWFLEYENLTAHLRLPAREIGQLRTDWYQGGHALRCVRAASPRATPDGVMSPREIEEFQRVFRSGCTDSQKRTALKLLVLAGLEPVAAWEYLKTFTPRTPSLPNGQWLPRPPDDKDESRLYTFAAKWMPEEVVQKVLQDLPDRQGAAILSLQRLASMDESKARLIVELVIGEMRRRGAIPEDDARSRARIAVDLAIRELMAMRPFHWALLASTILVEDPGVGTMAVGLTVEGRIALFFGPSFVLSISSEQLCGVLVHELNHVILDHLRECPGPISTRDADAVTRHGWAWVIACEVTANEYVPYPLPGNPVTIEQFGLPPAESTYERYRKLCKRAARIDSPVDRILDVLAQVPKHHKDTIPRRRSRQVQPMKIAAAMVGAEMDEATAKMVGTEQLGAVEEIDPVEQPELRWNEVLRAVARRTLQRKAVRTYPSRRQPALVGIIPGRRRSRSWRHVMVAIDTSASMQAAELSQVLAELRALQRMGAKLAMVQCDADIRKHGWLRRTEEIRCVYGRGGTSLEPPFSREMLDKYTPDLIVYFTDGYGPAPKQPPANVEVLWILTGTAPRRPARWGRAVCMRPSHLRAPLGTSP